MSTLLHKVYIWPSQPNVRPSEALTNEGRTKASRSDRQAVTGQAVAHDAERIMIMRDLARRDGPGPCWTASALADRCRLPSSGPRRPRARHQLRHPVRATQAVPSNSALLSQSSRASAGSLLRLSSLLLLPDQPADVRRDLKSRRPAAIKGLEGQGGV